MQERIEVLKEKKLAGKILRMSFASDRTYDLWRSFMPRRNEIKNKTGAELYSVEIYGSGFFEPFDPSKEFDKWAAVEVSDYDFIPDEMKTLTIPSGLYAVFIHKGPASEGEKTYQYIFTQWLPASEFVLDNRPQFAVMGEKYQSDDPSSEEEIWIPIRKK